ncbi:MAG: hypothetical protein O7D94_04675 [Planctomycetota bacterium]|nr:hypothetical protein [Planctomycetota bacterium]
MTDRACIRVTLLVLGLHGSADRAGADDLTSVDVVDAAECRRLLDGIQDNVFSFDDDAFYCFCSWVASMSNDGQPIANSGDDPVPWRFMLERPGDYRGRWIALEGTLQRRSTFRVPDRLGDLDIHQCELSAGDTRSFCTVITIDDPGGIPIRSRVIAEGYFIKVRAYTTSAGESGAGPLIVARGLRVIDAPPARASNDSDGSGPGGWLVGGTAALAVVWLVLRRTVRRKSLRTSSRPGGGVETDNDFDWLTRPKDGTG